jgi:hypothetical protein
LASDLLPLAFEFILVHKLVLLVHLKAGSICASSPALLRWFLNFLVQTAGAIKYECPRQRRVNAPPHVQATHLY